MRTTINVDEDVLLAVQERARRERRTAGQVLSELARKALTGEAAAPPAGNGVHGFEPLPHRGAVVSNALIERLLDDDAE